MGFVVGLVYNAQMIERKPLLGITGKTIEAVCAKWQAISQERPTYVRYARTVFSKMGKDQPGLLQFLVNFQENGYKGIGVEINDHPVFVTSILHAYDMLASSISEEDRKRPITKQLISETWYKILGHDAFGEDMATKKSGGRKIGIDLAWFYEELYKDSPDFVIWYESMLKELDGWECKSDFIFGVTFITMPFYLMKEADQLIKPLSGSEQID